MSYSGRGVMVFDLHAFNTDEHPLAIFLSKRQRMVRYVGVRLGREGPIEGEVALVEK
jgi:hypothetical protein